VTKAPLFILLGVLGVAPGVAAQSPVVEIEFGGGYTFGGGGENPGPTVPTVDATIAVWPSARWGIAARLVRGLGEDLHVAPAPIGDRTFLGQCCLEYYTLTARHRRRIPHDLGMEIGFGLLFGGAFGAVVMFHDPPRRSAAQDTFFDAGYALEMLITRALARRIAVKAGLTFEGNFETTNLQPVALAVVRF
jgi:hypothetical protein